MSPTDARRTHARASNNMAAPPSGGRLIGLAYGPGGRGPLSGCRRGVRGVFLLLCGRESPAQLFCAERLGGNDDDDDWRLN